MKRAVTQSVGFGCILIIVSGCATPLNLGKVYYEGKGIEKNSVEAYIWLKLAKNQDPSCSQKYDKVAESLTLEELFRVWDL